MKEIKAYIKRRCVNNTVTALDAAGAPGITVVEVHPVGYGYEPNYFESQFSDAFKRYENLHIVKLEVVCADKDWERMVETIRRTCQSGESGDGWIFVTDVEKAVRIKDGASGEDVLEQAGEGTGIGD